MDLPSMSEAANFINTGLLALISALTGIVAYFVKKTFDKTDGLEEKFLEREKKVLDLQIEMSEHKQSIALTLSGTRGEISDTLEKMRDYALDVKTEVVKSTGVVTDLQKTVDFHTEALKKALEVDKHHQQRITQAEDSIVRLGNDLIMIKNRRK